MAAFWLKVIASDHVFYNGNCESLVVPAHDGEVGILPHREAMILAIQEDDFDVCVTARRADTAQKENDDATVMLEEDLYLAVPSHSPYGSRESIRLTDSEVSLSKMIWGVKPASIK